MFSGVVNSVGRHERSAFLVLVRSPLTNCKRLLPTQQISRKFCWSHRLEVLNLSNYDVWSHHEFCFLLFLLFVLFFIFWKTRNLTRSNDYSIKFHEILTALVWRNILHRHKISCCVESHFVTNFGNLSARVVLNAETHMVFRRNSLRDAENSPGSRCLLNGIR